MPVPGGPWMSVNVRSSALRITWTYGAGPQTRGLVEGSFIRNESSNSCRRLTFRSHRHECSNTARISDVTQKDRGFPTPGRKPAGDDPHHDSSTRVCSRAIRGSGVQYALHSCRIDAQDTTESLRFINYIVNTIWQSMTAHGSVVSWPSIRCDTFDVVTRLSRSHPAFVALSLRCGAAAVTTALLRL